MRVLVTGAAGFLGSHLCDRLRHAGHTVIGVDNFVTGSRENLLHLEDDPEFTLIEQDVTFEMKVSGPLDVVFHLASPASPAEYLRYPIQTLKVGSLGTHNTLGLAKVKNARFFLASTSEVYGDPQVHPQAEIYWGHVNPVGPRGVYDEAKRFAEAMTMAYHREHGVDTRIARIFNTYGPRMRLDDGRVVSNFVVQAVRGDPLTVYGDGTQTRSFCYVEDLIEGFLRLIEVGGHGPVNLGNDQEFTIRELAGIVLRIAESGSALVHESLPIDDPKQRRPDLMVAERTLGWKPVVPLEEGLRRTVADFRERLAPTRPLASR